MSGWPAEALLLLGAFLLPLAVSGLLTAILIRGAPRLGLVDQPSARKFHTRPTPRGGGLAIYAAFALAVVLFHQRLGIDVLRLVALGLVIVVLGLVDDLRPLPWQLRLAVQAAVAIAIVAPWPAECSWGLRALAVLWMVGLVNAFNMLDNMDALSAGVAWIAAACFGVLAVLGQVLGSEATTPISPSGSPALPYLLFLGAVAGFWWFNQPPARIFMGDAGSTFLGFFLGVRSLEGSSAGPAAASTWEVALCVLAVPCYDLVSVVALRLAQGRSPFHADKQHLSHRLVALGLRSPQAVRVIWLFGLASGVCGLAMDRVSGWAAGLIGGQLALWWLAVAAVEYVRPGRLRPGQPAEAKSSEERSADSP